MTGGRHLAAAALLAIGAAWWAGCASEKAPGPVAMSDQEQEDWEIRLVEHRIDKNESFMDPEQTPLRAEDLPGFEGLNYYFPDPAFRYRLPLETAAGNDTVVLDKRKGQKVAYLRKGQIRFDHGGKVYRLFVYGPVDTTQYGDYLWLPFYDATSGDETYGGGRYLDLEKAADGTVEVDFNFCYNPLCDYNPDRWNCTLPPEDNRLPFPVTAGEKLFHPHDGGDEHGGGEGHGGDAGHEG